MNKIIVLGIVGIIVLGIVLVFNFAVNEDSHIIDKEIPATKLSEIDREKFCGTSDAQSTKYVKEFKIPTQCTQPQAITVDSDGIVWFAQSNTASIGKFDTKTKTFTEYKNPSWQLLEPTMISGIGYASDDSLWFTDDKYDSLWKFNIVSQQFHRFSFPSDGSSIPQKLKINGSQMIVNDLTGNKIAIYDLTTPRQNLDPFLIPSNNPRSVTSPILLDDKDNIWYPTWEPNATGVIIKINQTSLDLAMRNFTSSSSIDIDFFALPRGLSINGITFDNNGFLWLADSSSSSFYKFKPDLGNSNFTEFVTPKPSVLSYGNYSGNIMSPISSPNWMDSDSEGNLVFNEPLANRIALFNPQDETLIEYDIPSRNPHWADCGIEKNCGIAQILEFAVDGQKIWFTEWAENKIGYVDTSIPIPIQIKLDTDNLPIKKGETLNFEFALSSSLPDKIPIHLVTANTAPDSGLEVQLNIHQDYLINSQESLKINATIHAKNNTASGQHKILFGTTLPDIFIGKFATVLVN